MKFFRITVSMLTCVFLIGFYTATAQDILILRTGDELQVKVIEISSDVIKYKKWINQEGPDYTVAKSDVFMIKYINGTKDVFDKVAPPANPTTSNAGTENILNQAQTYLSAVIIDESKGALKLISLKKENGVQQNIYGQRVYALAYVLVIEAQRDFWKQSEGLLNKDWYWERFFIQTTAADVYAETFQGIQSKQYSKGSQIEIEGTMSFAETDNGWLPTDVNSFSNGYKNSSSRDIRLGGPSTPVSPTPVSNISAPSSTTSAVQNKYEGEYKDGKKNGLGNMNYANGDYYNGNWKEDQLDGFGKMIYANGDIYEGDWLNGKKEGKGKFTSGPTGYMEGEWAKDKLNGQGIRVLDIPGGAKVTYKGEFRNGSLFNGVEETLAGENRSVKSENLYVDGMRGKNKLVKH